MLDKWLSSSTVHFNIFVGLTFAVALTSIGIMGFLYRKIGKRDERTSVLYLNVSNIMLVTLLALLTLFIAWVDKDTIHFRQLLLAIMALTFGSGAAGMIVAARK